MDSFNIELLRVYAKHGPCHPPLGKRGFSGMLAKQGLLTEVPGEGTMDFDGKTVPAFTRFAITEAGRAVLGSYAIPPATEL